ncbi:MAG TPA: hypothetical protein VHK67_01030 [Rhabdochlamydiaceae bacterium]|jgi:hypothetical protein|nr:hypothetical protein [Rhabdochlamydiaceae bacterium]
MNAFITITVISSLLTFFHSPKPTIESNKAKKLLKFIFKKLPLRGILRKDAQGLVYVNINNNYIHKLIQFIQDEGFEAPPYFGKGKHGAHITVMPMNEILYYAVGEIKECGKAIQFEPKECQIIHPEAWKPGEFAFLITVEAPALDLLREKYHLPQKKHDFHITIGIKTSN